MKAVIFIVFFFYSFIGVAQDWDFNQKLVSSDRVFNDELGKNIAISGDYAIASSVSETDENGLNTLTNAGAAYIFEKQTDGTWSQYQKIVASDREAHQFFGYGGVAIDNNFIIVGSGEDHEDENGNNTLTDAGSAYIFEKNTSNQWIEVQKIVASDRATQDKFGDAIAISGDYLVVGAWQEDEDENGNNTLSNSGSVYVFKRNTSGVWEEVQKIVASDRGVSHFFGYSVDIYDDTIVVGSRYRYNPSTNTYPGGIYVFKKNASGVWVETQILIPNDAENGDQISRELAIYNDIIITGTIVHKNDITNSNPLNVSGAAFVFEKNGSGTWIETQKLVAVNRAENDAYGFSVAVYNDYIIVGAYGDDEDEIELNPIGGGSAYIYKKNSGTGVWELNQKVVASDRDGDELFGFSVDLTGNDIIIGAPFDHEDENNANPEFEAGSLYFYKINTGLGVHENTFNETLVAYPNPTKGKVNIQFATPQNKLSIKVYNVLGQLVNSFSLDNVLSPPIELPNTKGLYFISLENSNGHSATIKVLKE